MVRPDHWSRHVGGPDHIGDAVGHHCCHRDGCHRSNAADDCHHDGHRHGDCRLCVLHPDDHRAGRHRGAADADHYPIPGHNAVPNDRRSDRVVVAGGSSRHPGVVVDGSSFLHLDVVADDSNRHHPDVAVVGSNHQAVVVAEVCSSREVVHPNHCAVAADDTNGHGHDKNRGRGNIDPSRCRHQR